MNKDNAIKLIESFLEKRIEELQKELGDKVNASVIQCSDSNEIDSFSRQYQTINEEQEIKARIDKTLKEKYRLKRISQQKMDSVREGCLLDIKNLHIYIGIAIPAILVGEKQLLGISTAAPIYKTLEKQSVGFRFVFNGLDCVIESIQ